MLKQMKVSDLIGENDISSWVANKPVIISAGTGTGKNYFVETKLYNYITKIGKRLLVLVNRSATKESIIERTYRLIDVFCYQSIEVMTEQQAYEFLLQYDYIVCDEAHYFCNDALFNKTIDKTVEEIFAANHAVRIFMTGTIDEIKKLICHHIKENGMDKPITYIIESDYSKIDLSFYDSSDTIERVLGSTPEKEKVLVFCDSASDAYELYEKHKQDSMFICSRSNDKYAKYMDLTARKVLLKEECFPTKYLFTTNALNNGINIKDDAVTRIICDIGDVTTLRQCVGRKRISENDNWIKIWVKRRPTEVIESWLRTAETKIDIIETFKRNITEYSEKYSFPGKDISDCIYIDKYGQATIREARYYKILKDAETYRKILDLGEYGYCKYVAELFHKHIDENRYGYSIDSDGREQIRDYLYKFTIDYREIIDDDVPLLIGRKDREEFVRKLGFTHKVGNKKRLYKKISDINDCLIDIGLSCYTIKELVGNDRKIYWYVVYEDNDYYNY